MDSEKSIVVTVYGREKEIDKIVISSFDEVREGYYGYSDENAKTYCKNINNLKLEGESWVSAKIISEYTQYTLEELLPLRFDTILLNYLDDRSIQKIMREFGYKELALALKGESEALQEKIFNNMSKRAVQMLKEEMEYMGPIAIEAKYSAQEKIVNIIRHLEDTGEIVFTYNKGETVE